MRAICALSLFLLLGLDVLAQTPTVSPAAPRRIGVWRKDQIPAGYQPVQDSEFYVYTQGETFDVACQFGTRVYSSSVDGYRTYFRVNGGAIHTYNFDDPSRNFVDGMRVSITMEKSGNANTLRIRYNVTNESGQPQSISIGSYYDCIIGMMDQEAVKPNSTSASSVSNINIKEAPESKYHYLLRWANVGGYEGVDTYWWGAAGVQRDHPERVLGEGYVDQLSAEEQAMEQAIDTNGDYGVSWSWQDRVIEPGKTVGKYAVFLQKNPNMEYSSPDAPDLTITAFDVSHDQMEAGGELLANLEIQNIGTQFMPSGVLLQIINAYDKELLWSAYTEQKIFPNGTLRLAPTFPAPSRLGRQHLLARVNMPDDKELRYVEVDYANNQSKPLAISIEKQYTSSLHTDKTMYQQGASVRFSGQVEGYDVAYKPVEIVLKNLQGGTVVLTTVSQEDGSWVYPWESYDGWAGHIQAWARYPKSAIDPAHPQADFDVLGLQSQGPYDTQGEDVSHCHLVVEGRDTLIWKLANPGSIDLTGITVTASAESGHILADVHCPSVLKAGETASLQTNILALHASEGTKYETLTLTLTTAEGLQRTLSIPYYIKKPSAILVADVSEINTTMLAGGSVSYSLTLTNQGGVETGAISLSLPRVNWMKSVTPQTIPSLQPGEQSTVMLCFEPDENLPVSVEQRGRIAFVMASGDGLVIPYSIENVSQSTGLLHVDVRDEYTYHTEAHPHLAGATVTVRDLHTADTVATTVSGVDGTASLELPAGWYVLDVCADKHESYSEKVYIAPCRSTDIIVNICLQTIHFNYEVKETEVTDSYDIVSTITYETMVPAPVIEMMFDKQPLESMQPGDVLIFNIALINHGLIRADSLVLKLPNDELYQIDALKTVPDHLDAQTSVIIPVRILCLVADKEAGLQMPRRASSPYCNRVVSISWSYPCGDTKHCQVGMTLGYTANTGDCGDLPGEAGDYSGRGGSTGSGGSISRGGTSGQSRVGCQCIPDMSRAITDCYIGTLASALPLVGQIYGAVMCLWDIGNLVYNFKEIKASGDYSSVNSASFGCLMAAMNFLPVPAIVSSALNVLSCSSGMYTSMSDCNGGKSSVKAVRQAPATLDELLTHPEWSKEGQLQFVVDFMEKQDIAYDFLGASINIYREMYGDSLWLVVDDVEMSRLLEQITTHEAPYLVADYAQYRPAQVSEESFARLLERFSGTNEDNIIRYDRIAQYLEVIGRCDRAIHEYGYNSLDEMMEEECKAYIRHEEAQKGAVCASVKLQLHQTMALTRQAFEGTLTIHNGHETEEMKDVKLQLLVTNERGEVLTTHEMDASVALLTGLQGRSEVGSAWTLAPGGDGAATLRFIPTRYAAPDGPSTCFIRGTLSYLDPFTGQRAQFVLAPVPIVIQPTPVLDLIYFQQRDVMADNPLTEEVEPSEEVEFALLVLNRGQGDATKVSMITEQPKIVDNEKGLLLHYDMLSSQLNGGDKVLALGRDAVTEFGNIPANSSAYAQWWMESSLMGHFVDYDVTYTHANANGNPDLSLIDSISIHELIRGLAVEHDGVVDPAWLTNDYPDGNNRPDHLYLTDGTVLPVSYARAPVLEKSAKNSYQLTLSEGETEWQYGVVDDPTDGHGRVACVTRLSDGTLLPTRNFWISRYTFLDGVEPIKENRLHFAVQTGAGDNTFCLEFWPMPDKYLCVEELVGLPEAHSWATSPVSTLSVRFNKPIDPSTFTIDDVRLSHEGVVLDLGGVKILPGRDDLNREVYKVELGALTDDDGFYVFSVQTAGITDMEGYHGEKGLMANWMQVNVPTDVPTPSVPSMQHRLYDLSGRILPYGCKPTKGIYIRDGRKVVSW